MPMKKEKTLKTKEWHCYTEPRIDSQGKRGEGIFCTRKGMTKFIGVSLFKEKIHIAGLKCEDVGIGRLRCPIGKKKR